MFVETVNIMGMNGKADFPEATPGGPAGECVIIFLVKGQCRADRLAAFPGAVEPICIMFPLKSDMGRTGAPASVKTQAVVLTLAI